MDKSTCKKLNVSVTFGEMWIFVASAVWLSQPFSFHFLSRFADVQQSVILEPSTSQWILPRSDKKYLPTFTSHAEWYSPADSRHGKWWWPANQADGKIEGCATLKIFDRLQGKKSVVYLKKPTRNSSELGIVDMIQQFHQMEIPSGTCGHLKIGGPPNTRGLLNLRSFQVFRVSWKASATWSLTSSLVQRITKGLMDHLVIPENFQMAQISIHIVYDSDMSIDVVSWYDKMIWSDMIAASCFF